MFPKNAFTGSLAENTTDEATGSFVQYTPNSCADDSGRPAALVRAVRSARPVGPS